MSAAGRALSKAMDKSGDFTLSGSRLIHEPTGLIFWIGNGPLFFNGYDGTPKCLGLLERHWLYWKFKRKATAALIQKFAEAEAEAK